MQAVRWQIKGYRCSLGSRVARIHTHVHIQGYGIRDATPIVQNRREKKIEAQMGTGVA